jgi:hypothetical protein
LSNSKVKYILAGVLAAATVTYIGLKQYGALGKLSKGKNMNININAVKKYYINKLTSTILP